MTYESALVALLIAFAALRAGRYYIQWRKDHDKRRERYW